MSTVIAKNVQIGADTTATNNFTIYQPATPNGTLLIGNGNTGITSSLVTLTSAGNVGIGTSSVTSGSRVTIAGGNLNLTQSDSRFIGGDTVGRSLFANSDVTTYIAMYGSSHATVPNVMSLVANGNSLNLNSSGNLGLGVTPATTWTSAAKVMQLGGFNSIFGYSNNVFRLANNAVFNASNETYGASSLGATYYQQYNGLHSWYNAPSGTAGNAISWAQAMTLDASGNLYVNATALAQNKNYFAYSAGNAFGEFSHESGVASGIGFVNFRYNGIVIGSISQNGTTQVLYNVSSDHRLKDITGPVTGTEAKDFIMALQPKQGTWKADDSRFVGFVAHEFQEVSPLSVTGTKDAVDAEGNPVMQAMQASSPEVMANLIAHIQNLEQRLAALEAA